MDRDAYGFPTAGLSEDEMLARQASSLRARKLVKSWQGLTMLSAADLQSRATALKPLLRKGLPFEYRPAVWYVLSGAASKRGLYPDNFYASICCQPPPELDVHLALQEDIRSGFRQHALFHTPHGLAALQRILFAFFQHNPDVGYFRGLVQMAAFILIVFTLDKEEEAFWVLVAVMEGRMVTSPSEQVALAGKVEQKVLEQLVQKKMPKVYQHVARAEGGFAPLTTWWFSSAFTTALPAETAVRVWDAMMLEGRKVLLRVALALLKKYETVLLSCSREEQMKRVLDVRCLRTYDAEALLQLAFKGIGSMPNNHINLLRADACKDVALRYEQLHQRLSGMVTRVV